MLHGDVVLPLAEKGPFLGVLADADDGPALDAVVAFRLVRGLSRRVASLDETFYSASDFALSGLDQLVLMTSRFQDDVLALTAIKHWLNAGGRLWIMLDQVDEQAVACLLEDACEFQIVDRSSLTECTIKSRQPGTISSAGLSLQFEQPQAFCRTLVPSGEILQTVEGWPAAFTVRYGKGLVLLTTLAGPGWVRPRGATEIVPADPKNEVALLATPALDEIAFHFSAPKPNPVLRPSDLEAYVAENIGYRVLPRWTMGMILGSFCTAWMAIGVRRTRRCQGEHAAWFGALLAIATTISLLGLGRLARQSIPDTVAIAQWIEANPDGFELEQTGLLGLYQASEVPAEIGTKSGGLMERNRADEDGRLHRLVWTDHDEWYSTQSRRPLAVNFAAYRSSVQIEQRLAAKATFGPDGLAGRIDAGPLKNVSDAVIALPGGKRLPVTLNDRREFSASSLSTGDYVANSVLSDEQRRRQSIYQKLFHQRTDYPLRPVCLVWADPMESDWKLPPQSQRRGAALVAIPLAFERPQPGRSFTIPRQILAYDSIGPSGAYDPKNRQWGKLSYSRQTTLRFQIPPEILPIQLNQAVLSITIDAPARSLEITDGLTEGARVWKRFASPVGTVRCTLETAEQLQLDAQGGLVLGINVGEVSEHTVNGPSTGAKSFWQIGDVQLELRGQTVQPHAE